MSPDFWSSFLLVSWGSLVKYKPLKHTVLPCILCGVRSGQAKGIVSSKHLADKLADKLKLTITCSGKLGDKRPTLVADGLKFISKNNQVSLISLPADQQPSQPTAGECPECQEKRVHLHATQPGGGPSGKEQGEDETISGDEEPWNQGVQETPAPSKELWHQIDPDDAPVCSPVRLRGGVTWSV